MIGLIVDEDRQCVPLCLLDLAIVTLNCLFRGLQLAVMLHLFAFLVPRDR